MQVRFMEVDQFRKLAFLAELCDARVFDLNSTSAILLKPVATHL